MFVMCCRERSTVGMFVICSSERKRSTVDMFAITWQCDPERPACWVGCRSASSPGLR